jgi:DNA replication and repair protein RecF
MSRPYGIRMSFERVRLASFRNLEDAEIGTDADRVFLVGENGQGKTNFLEALYYLSYASSFRGPVDAEAVKRGATAFSLAGKMRSSSDSASDEIRVRWEAKVKDIRRNEKPIRDRKELVELNPSIVFCHEDYAFAAGEPERRRYFFDQAAGLVSIGYIDTLRDYKRILKQRNAALKENRRDLLDLLDQQLAAKGLELIEARARLRSEFDSRFASRYEAVSLLGEEVHLRYRPSWPVDADIDAILGKLAAKRGEELSVGTSLSGPHRDRWAFDLAGRDFAATASTGQLRLLSLTLRMVQAEYYTAVVERLPVLLLDDVLLELDRGKRQRFLELLPPAAQAFFTFLPGEGWKEYSSGQTLVYEVRDGRFED